MPRADHVYVAADVCTCSHVLIYCPELSPRLQGLRPKQTNKHVHEQIGLTLLFNMLNAFGHELWNDADLTFLLFSGIPCNKVVFKGVE